MDVVFLPHGQTLLNHPLQQSYLYVCLYYVLMFFLHWCLYKVVGRSVGVQRQHDSGHAPYAL